jgi:2-amino-4-hydroxy-6-hydroxymethyldihydropteridine diphosphokinase
MQKQELYLSLGSNLGNKHENIRKAFDMITLEVGDIISSSALYKTQAWGNEDQEDFLNQVVRLYSDLEPTFLLKTLLAIEDKLGRVRDDRWGPRLIDIDILYYGNYVIDRDDLIIPHPELTERKFVLVPLSEIAPTYQHPIFRLSNVELLEFCTDTRGVEKC